MTAAQNITKRAPGGSQLSANGGPWRDGDIYTYTKYFGTLTVYFFAPLIFQFITPVCEANRFGKINNMAFANASSFQYTDRHRQRYSFTLSCAGIRLREWTL